MSSNSSNRLLVLIITGILSGIFLGGFIPDAGTAVSFLGELFLRALFVMVVPLVMSSMVVGVSSLGDVRKLGRLGGRTVLFFMTTTAIAVSIGLMLVLIIHPGVPLENLETSGERMQEVSERMEDKPTTLGDLLKTILTSLVPKNLFSAMANTEILPLIVFSLIFGGILTTIGEKGIIVIRFFEGINEAIMGIVHLLMWVAPIGIGALVAGATWRSRRIRGVLAAASNIRRLCGNSHSCASHSWPDRLAHCAEISCTAICFRLCQGHECTVDDSLFH